MHTIKNAGDLFCPQKSCHIFYPQNNHVLLVYVEEEWTIWTFLKFPSVRELFTTNNFHILNTWLNLELI